MTLRELLTSLGATLDLQQDDAQPAAIYDPSEQVTYIGEIRTGTEDDEFVSCDVDMVYSDERRQSVCTLRAAPENGS